MVNERAEAEAEAPAEAEVRKQEYAEADRCRSSWQSLNDLNHIFQIAVEGATWPSITTDMVRKRNSPKRCQNVTEGRNAITTICDQCSAGRTISVPDRQCTRRARFDAARAMKWLIALDISQMHLFQLRGCCARTAEKNSSSEEKANLGEFGEAGER
jgi:hypothetical protein